MERADPVGQATRSQWQRRAADLLLHQVDQNQWLPAIIWTISIDGQLSGRPGRATRPEDGRFVFTAWQETLQLGREWEQPGHGGRPGSLHAAGTWGAVTVSLSARVLPPEAAGARPDDGPGSAGYGHLLTRHSWLAAWVLPDLLEKYADVPAIAWQVSPSASLTGHVSDRTSGWCGRDIFTAWSRALHLEEPVRTPARLIASAEFSKQPVTVALGMPAWPDPRPERVMTARRPTARPMISPSPRCASALPPPRPDSNRRGPSQRP